MKHASIDGRSHQVICSSDGVDITSEMQIKLKPKENPAKVKVY